MCWQVWEVIKERKEEEGEKRSIGAILFLYTICPSLVIASSSQRKGEGRRNLVFIAKMMQALANDSCYNEYEKLHSFNYLLPPHRPLFSKFLSKVLLFGSLSASSFSFSIPSPFTYCLKVYEEIEKNEREVEERMEEEEREKMKEMMKHLAPSLAPFLSSSPLSSSSVFIPPPVHTHHTSPSPHISFANPPSLLPSSRSKRSPSPSPLSSSPPSLSSLSSSFSAPLSHRSSLHRSQSDPYNTADVISLSDHIGKDTRKDTAKDTGKGKSKEKGKDEKCKSKKKNEKEKEEKEEKVKRAHRSKSLFSTISSSPTHLIHFPTPSDSKHAKVKSKTKKDKDV